MSYRYERYNERPRRSSFRCLIITLTILTIYHRRFGLDKLWG